MDVNLFKNDKFLLESLQNEVTILKTLKGLNTLGLIEYLQSTHNIYIMQ